MFVFPMAGISKRFFDAGYTKPKYMLPLNGRSLFFHSVSGFNAYFETDIFVFICRDIYNTKYFLEKEIKDLGIKKFEIVFLESQTNGQAETVALGLKNITIAEEIFIFNIDTFRLNYKKPEFINEVDGYLETFIGGGKNWSNVVADNLGRVILTAEKEEISNYCCTGLYYFKDIFAYRRIFDSARLHENKVRNEYYVAPLYNSLIRDGQLIRFTIVQENEVIFCGTPDEYWALGGALPDKKK